MCAGNVHNGTKSQVLTLICRFFCYSNPYCLFIFFPYSLCTFPFPSSISSYCVSFHLCSSVIIFAFEFIFLSFCPSALRQCHFNVDLATSGQTFILPFNKCEHLNCTFNSRVNMEYVFFSISLVRYIACSEGKQ